VKGQQNFLKSSEIGFVIFVLLIGVSCSNRPYTIDEKNIPIQLEIIPEDGNGGYALLWNDSLCPSFLDSSQFLAERPYELYCFVTNSNNDTLGRYTGLSSPRQFTYFQVNPTTDSLINIPFRVGINHFSRYLQQQSKSYIRKFNQNNTLPVVFETVTLNLNDVKRKKLNIVLQRKMN
jgi:hypothetical protein